VKHDSTAVYAPIDHKSDAKALNYASAVKYAQSVDSLTMWGLLCEYSKYGKEVHNGQFTLLCPSNATLRAYGMDAMKALKQPENLPLLNDLMAAHILKTNTIVSKWVPGDAFEALNGKKYEVGPRSIGKATFYAYDFATKQGNVVVIDRVLDFPQELMKK
jgi:hypothetical protein